MAGNDLLPYQTILSNTGLSLALITSSWWTCCSPDMSGSLSDVRRNVGQVRVSTKVTVVKTEGQSRGRIACNCQEAPKDGDEGCVWFLWHKCTSVCRWHSDSCWCLSNLDACLIFCIYPPGPALTVPAHSSPVIKSPIMTLRTFLGDTILFNYTRDYGPGTLVAQQNRATLCILGILWWQRSSVNQDVWGLTPGDGERCERVLIRSE